MSIYFIVSTFCQVFCFIECHNNTIIIYYNKIIFTLFQLREFSTCLNIFKSKWKSLIEYKWLIFHCDLETIQTSNLIKNNFIENVV